MNQEVTLFITSCGRPELLKRTLESFVKFNTYPIKEAILCEDSGIPNIVDFVTTILPFPVLFCYNKERIGQMKTIEKYTQLIKTPYVFHLEDDWEFFDSGFIELSFQILDTDPKITQVLIDDDSQRGACIDIGNSLCNKKVNTPPFDENGQVTLYSWRPSLKSIEIQKLRMPYEPWDDEHTILLLVNKLGLYSVIPKDKTTGFCRHIGQDEHIISDYQGIQILGRSDFPDKRNITLKEI